MGKIPPQALDIEEAVLGICMLYPDAIFELRLQPQMFYRESHQLIYAAMLEISKKGICDVLTVTNHLRNQGELDRIGGPIYITKLIGNVFSDQMAPNYALILREKFIRREYIRLSQEIQNLAFDDSQDLADVIEFTESGLFKVSDITQVREAEHLRVLIGQEIEEVKKIMNKEKKLTGIPTGYTKIDRITGGWQDGELIIIAARPSMGKTAMAINLALNAARLKYDTALFSLEMARGKIATRIIAYASGYSNIQIRNAEVDLETIIDKSLDVSSYNIWIDDTPALSLFELRSKIKKLIVKKGIRMAIVDYLQLMRGEGKSREEEVSSISRGLKRMALEFGIPIIALAQLNRKVEERREKRPMLSDLRESGSIEQDADVVWLLWRPAYYDIPTVVDEERNEVSSNGLMVIDIAKNRNGATGDFNLWHNEPMTVIQDEEPKLQNLPY
jgi:replicative DNA helicase